MPEERLEPKERVEPPERIRAEQEERLQHQSCYAPSCAGDASPRRLSAPANWGLDDWFSLPAR
jgi:hypothetical protein